MTYYYVEMCVGNSPKNRLKKENVLVHSVRLVILQ